MLASSMYGSGKWNFFCQGEHFLFARGLFNATNNNKNGSLVFDLFGFCGRMGLMATSKKSIK